MNITLLYATTSGNSALVAETIRTVCENNGHSVYCVPVESFRDMAKLTCDLLVIGCGTYGHGQLQERMRVFVEKTTKNTDLAGQACAVFGLGDDMYDHEYTCEAATLLEQWVTTHGGALAIPTMRIVKTPIPILETRVREWARGLQTVTMLG